MGRKKTALILFGLLALISTVQIAYYAPRLPDRVASHFGADGTPDGWTDKTGLFVIYGIALGLTALLFLGCGWLVRKLPPSLVNLPNRDYWLAPERKEETCADLDGRLHVLGSATLAFLLFLFHLIFKANLEEEILGLGIAPWILTALYLGYTTWWCVRLFRRFRKPQDN